MYEYIKSAIGKLQSIHSKALERSVKTVPAQPPLSIFTPFLIIFINNTVLYSLFINHTKI